VSLALYFKYMMRESRGSGPRLTFFVVCLAVGVAAVVAVAGLSAGIDQGLQLQAREILAADLVVQARRPLPDELDVELAGMKGVERADVKEFVSVVVAASGPSAGTSRLSQLKIVEGAYPFYGTLQTSPQGTLSELLGEDEVVADEALLSQMKLRPGGILRIGGEDFRISATLLNEPDRLDIGFASLAPRIFISPGGLERSGLVRFGSRISYKALIKLPGMVGPRAVAAAAKRIKDAMPASAHLNIETYSEAQPALRNALDRAEKFLGLVALLSLLIGGIGVAQTVRAWLTGKFDSIATLKCLGLRPREVFTLYLGQTALLGVAGSLAGIILGVISQMVTPWVLGDVIPVQDIQLIQPMAILKGLGLGVGVALLFSLPPLYSVRLVPPARVFRNDAEPLSASLWIRGMILASVIAGIFTTAFIQSQSLSLSLGFTGGILALTLLLALSALAVTKFVATAPRRFVRVWLRHGLSSLSRPGASTLGAIVALGLGVGVVLGMFLIEEGVSGRFEAEMPADAPSIFMLDIQNSQWDGIRSLLEAEGSRNVESVPVINARFRSVDGVPVEELAEKAPETGRARWVLTREQRLTYMEKLPESNTIVEGALWSDPDKAEVSVEKDFAKDLGAGIGTVLEVDIQGVIRELTVTSIREVEWESFKINFFLVVEPGVMEDAPQIRLASALLPPEREQPIQDRIAGIYPNVTLIQLRKVLDRIIQVMSRAGLGVRVLGGFTVISGIFILAGAVSAGTVRRGREVALFKTLGMTRREVLAVYSVEYALIGLVAGLLGTAGAGLLSALILDRWMDIRPEFHPAAFAVTIVATVILSVAAGGCASIAALSRRPVEVLRNQ
jgi:putative ABC transport system permease protein